jgi:hypothetical protein
VEHEGRDEVRTTPNRLGDRRRLAALGAEIELGNFIITIDTEGDNLWDAPETITTRNTAYLPRFQALCEKYGLRPTYLVNYEMACDEAFVEFGRDVVARDQGEIGMHLHAWNSPPIVPLTTDDMQTLPYLVEYPEPVLRDKVAFMTDLLEETFEREVTSHRAGRWAFDGVYARALADNGYLVDCSVTPHVDWRRFKGDPRGDGGTDYRRFSEEPYFLDLHDISRAGDSALLEVPMSVHTECPTVLHYGAGAVLRRVEFFEKVLDRVWPKRWVRPNGRNLAPMLAQVGAASAAGAAHVEFMLHSSELMPGGSPTFKTDESIERLYDHLDALFERASALFHAATLTEFRALFAAAAPAAARVREAAASGAGRAA